MIMARKKRSLALNICHHVMLRGIDGERIFQEKSDFYRLCLMLQKSVEDHGFKIHAFCFMSNHIHLIIEPTCSFLHICVHSFAARYAQYYNKKYKRKGYLFQGRFRSIVVSSGIYLKRLIRYIHLNPLEEKIVSNLDDYPWSSHRAYMNLIDYTWLTKDHVLSHFGKNSYDGAINLLKFIGAKVEAEEDLDQINSAFSTGAYGSKDFVQKHVKNSFIPEQLPINCKLDIKQVIEKVSDLFDLTPNQLASSSREKKIVDARSVLSLLAREVPNLSLYGVARELGKNHGTISRLAVRAADSTELQNYVEQLLVKQE